MHHFHGSITTMQQKRQKVRWARPGFEPGTTRTLSEYHTPRPTSQRYVSFLEIDNSTACFPRLTGTVHVFIFVEVARRKLKLFR